jgi:hypothetical protein
MRLPSELWVKAYLRRLSSDGLFAAVAKHGDDDLGAVWVKVNRLDGTAELYGPAPEPLDGARAERQWLRMHKAATILESDAELQLRRAKEFDSDLWIIEIEDRQGRHALDGSIVDD